MNKADRHYKEYWNKNEDLLSEALNPLGWVSENQEWTEPNGVEVLEMLARTKGLDYGRAKNRGYIDENDKVVPLTYKMDEYGFRIFNQDKTKKSIAVLGCSDTFGIGSFVKDTWAYKLSEAIGKPVWNFGIPGASMHINYESLLNHLGDKNITDLFWLIPDCRRTSLIRWNKKHKNYERLQVGANREAAMISEQHNFDTNNYFDLCRVSETKAYVDQMMIIDAVENICKYYNVNLYQVLNPFYLDNKIVQTKLRDDGRYLKVNDYEKGYDNSHLGVPFHNQVKEYFYFLYKNN